MNRYRVTLTHADQSWCGSVEAPNVDAAIRAAKALNGFPERATSESQRIDGPTPTSDDLVDALMRVLPFLEDMHDDPGYKPGRVDQVLADTRKLLRRAGAM